MDIPHLKRQAYVSPSLDYLVILAIAFERLSQDTVFTALLSITSKKSPAQIHARKQFYFLLIFRILSLRRGNRALIFYEVINYICVIMTLNNCFPLFWRQASLAIWLSPDSGLESAQKLTRPGIQDGSFLWKFIRGHLPGCPNEVSLCSMRLGSQKCSKSRHPNIQQGPKGLRISNKCLKTIQSWSTGHEKTLCTNLDEVILGILHLKIAWIYVHIFQSDKG